MVEIHVYVHVDWVGSTDMYNYNHRPIANYNQGFTGVPKPYKSCSHFH